MNRSEYYELIRTKARAVRKEHGLTTPKVMLSDLRRIYKAYGIGIDLWKGPMSTVRGMYAVYDGVPSVMVVKSLPDEQRIFTLAHELKHHFFDVEPIQYPMEKEPTEIGAEIFAVELIFPDQDFRQQIELLGVSPGCCTAKNIVTLKRHSQTTLSFTSLAKRAKFLGYASEDAFEKVQWKKLEEEMYGEPVYKRIQRYQRAKK